MYRVLGGDRKEYGPVSLEEVRRWLAEGRLNGQSLIKAEGTVDWRPLSTFPELTQTTTQAASTPPVIALGGAQSPEYLASQILSGEPQLEVGRCLARSAALLRDNFGLLAGSTALVWLISLSAFIPLIGLLYLVFVGVLNGGLYRVFLKRIRGEPASVSDTFSGFANNFGQLALAGFISLILAELGILFCAVPGIYLMVAWIFSVPLVADKRLEFWSAMELSRKVVTRVWFPMFGLLLAAFAPVLLTWIVVGVKSMAMALDMTRVFLAGGVPTITQLMQQVRHVEHTIYPLVLLAKFVLLLNLPFAAGAMMYAYEDLVGARTARTR
jgi:hypothetical protein